ncbi:MAG: hypothetical protein ACFE9T_11925 [Promethearchaeota archaeon]
MVLKAEESKDENWKKIIGIIICLSILTFFGFAIWNFITLTSIPFLIISIIVIGILVLIGWFTELHEESVYYPKKSIETIQGVTQSQVSHTSRIPRFCP